MDNLTPKQRHKNMQNIRSKNTTPELLVMSELKKRKIYFAKHASKILCKPDIVFRRKKIAVFIDSDFWHCNPKLFVMPKTNVTYWENKINRNKERDAKVNKTLRKEGWTVIRLWESEIKKDCAKSIRRILSALDK